VADEQNEFTVGHTIGHYQILSQLGAGGRGAQNSSRERIPALAEHALSPRTRTRRCPQAASWHLSHGRCPNYRDANRCPAGRRTRLIVYPLIEGEGKALFATIERHHGLELRNVQ